MSAVLTTQPTEQLVELLTFRVGKLLLGLDICRIKEINCRLQITRAPHALDYVLGVMNLRSDVICVLDFGRLLGLGTDSASLSTRGVIATHEGELIALAVDEIADVVTMPVSELEPLPTNFRRGDERCFQGVHVHQDELIFVLDLSEVLRKRY